MNISTIYIFYMMIIFHPVKGGGEEVKNGVGGCLSLSENNLTQLSFCNFFFMQKSCGQFVDVSDLNLVVCYLI